MNYKHLRYFWMAAKAGGVLRASEQLHVTPQTVSEQIRLLEEQLGCALFRKRGRNLELTEAGRTAMRYAEDIFSLGAEMQATLHGHATGTARLDFRVGVANSVPKSIAYRLLEPAMQQDEPVRIVCREANLQSLLSELALHKLDLVLADVPLPSALSVKAFNHALGRSGISFFGTAALRKRCKGPFPACLQGMPLLVPGAETAMHHRLERWLDRHGVQPVIVGEFDDSALMKAFGREGQGIFLAPSVIERETQAHYDVQTIGRADELREEFHAISVERRISHPGVAALMNAARDWLQRPA